MYRYSEINTLYGTFTPISVANRKLRPFSLNCLPPPPFFRACDAVSDIDKQGFYKGCLSFLTCKWTTQDQPRRVRTSNEMFESDYFINVIWPHSFSGVVMFRLTCHKAGSGEVHSWWMRALMAVLEHAPPVFHHPWSRVGVHWNVMEGGIRKHWLLCLAEGR